MDATDAFLRGAAIGLAVAAPVGPVGLLCIKRSLAGGPAAGIASGLGAAVADALYAAAAALGIATVMRFMAANAAAIGVGGGMLLLVMAGRALRAAPTAAAPTTAAASRADPRGLAAAFGSVLLLTLANPATVLSFVAVFAALGETAAARPLQLAAGVFCGSAAWWVGLALATSRLGRVLGMRGRRAVDLASAACLAAFGIWAIVAALR
jgi:threonine/homoserine/homoserine lactone efflux protein